MDAERGESEISNLEFQRGRGVGGRVGGLVSGLQSARVAARRGEPVARRTGTIRPTWLAHAHHVHLFPHRVLLRWR